MNQPEDAKKQPPRIVIETQLDGETLFADLDGILDGNTFEEVERVVGKAVQTHGPRRVTFDLSGVNHITSAGVGALIGFADGDREVAAAHSQETREVFDLLVPTGMFELLTPRERKRLAA